MAYDLYIVGLPPEEIKGVRFLSFGPNGKATAVNGIYKLVNRFMRCFVTPRGSDPSNPRYGTALMSLFMGNVDSASLNALASQAVQETIDWIKENEVEYVRPSSERLDSATVDDVVISEAGDGVEIVISIRNSEGTRAQFLLPVSAPTGS